MISDELYDLAYQYKKTKLWQKLWEDEIFAFQLTSGETAYISIDGKSGGCCSFSVYVGPEGYTDLFMLLNLDQEDFEDDFAFMEHVFSQNNLQMAFENKEKLSEDKQQEVRDYCKRKGIRLSGKNSYASFLKYEPHYLSSTVLEEKDQEILKEALKAAVLLGESFNEYADSIRNAAWTGLYIPVLTIEEGKIKNVEWVDKPALVNKPCVYVKANNPETIKTARSLPHRDVWQAEVVRLLKPIFLKGDDAPYFPLFLIIFNKESGYVHESTLIFEERIEDWIDEYVESWQLENTYPLEIRCADERTYALLKDISEKTNVTIYIIKKRMDGMEEAKKTLAKMLDGEPLDDDKTDEIDDRLLEMIEWVEGLSDAQFRLLPQEFIEALEKMVKHFDGDELVKPIAEKLRRNKFIH